MAIPRISASRTIERTAPIQSGDNTHHQDQLIFPNSFKVINTIVSSPVNPSPALEDDKLLIAYLFSFFDWLLFCGKIINMGNIDISEKKDDELIRITHKNEKWSEIHIAAAQELERIRKRENKKTSSRSWIAIFVALVSLIVSLISLIF